MSESAQGQRDILIDIANILNLQKIPYLLSGSFASSYYGQPRATHDIDFVVEVNQAELDRLSSALKTLGSDYVFDAHNFQSVTVAQMINIYHFVTAIKVDFWITDTSDFSTKYSRRRSVEIMGVPVRVIAPEDLLLTKLVWCKEVWSDRHMNDCIGIWRIQKGKLDMVYLHKRAKELAVVELLARVKKGNLQST